MSYKDDIEKGVDLLRLCQKLQCEKDGVDRPDIGIIDKSKTFDQFAKDVTATATWMYSLYKLVPLMNDLVALGHKLESDGELEIEAGEDYAREALNYFLKRHEVSLDPHRSEKDAPKSFQ